MKYISLFAGIGGFDLALDRLGHECVYTNEWDKHAAKVYEKQFNRTVDTRDIKTVQTTEIPDFDLLVGGFPCQAFSIAGKRLGFDDTRGTLFFEIARILKDRRPKYFILENVKGLISHNNGQTFRTIISTIAELGYDCQWNVLNSKDFGVPQNRERVFIIGYFRGTSRPEILFNRQTNESLIKVYQRGKHQQDIVYDPSGIMATLPAGTHASTPHLTKIIQINNPKHSGQRLYGKEGISPTITTGKKVWIPENYKIRRLTEVECERLQGFPDNWTDCISSTQRYKCLGNAVTVNVVYELAKNL